MAHIPLRLCQLSLQAWPYCAHTQRAGSSFTLMCSNCADFAKHLPFLWRDVLYTLDLSFGYPLCRVCFIELCGQICPGRVLTQLMNSVL